jgi:hypothetical protein
MAARWKWCPGCDLVLPAVAAEGGFYVRRASKDGLTARCRECIGECQATRYATDEGYRRRKNLLDARRHARLYATDPEYRAKHDAASRAWVKRNRGRVRELHRDSRARRKRRGQASE